MQQERQPRKYQTSELPDSTITRRMDPAWRCRALVVDDDDIVRLQLVALLKRSGFDVRGAANGEEALRALAAGNCQILLTDWQMPDMNGLDLCRNVRLGRHNSDVYVMMLTVRDREQDMLIGLAAGADDYLIKGAPNDEILARLEIARHCTQWEYPSRNGGRDGPLVVKTGRLED
jgi:DNA-binding response OmpR family regulator